MLWKDLGQNLLAGTRLALFLPVRALDFRISIGQYVALVFASLAFWVGRRMLRAGFPGTIDFGALTVALAEIPLLLGTCLLAARVFREAQLAVAFAYYSSRRTPFSKSWESRSRRAALAAVELDADAVVLGVRRLGLRRDPTHPVRTHGWRGRSSVLALGLFAGLLAILIAFSAQRALDRGPDDRAEAAVRG